MLTHLLAVSDGTVIFICLFVAALFFFFGCVWYSWGKDIKKLDEEQPEDYLGLRDYINPLKKVK